MNKINTSYDFYNVNKKSTQEITIIVENGTNPNLPIFGRVYQYSIEYYLFNCPGYLNDDDGITYLDCSVVSSEKRTLLTLNGPKFKILSNQLKNLSEIYPFDKFKFEHAGIGEFIFRNCLLNHAANLKECAASHNHGVLNEVKITSNQGVLNYTGSPLLRRYFQ